MADYRKRLKHDMKGNFDSIEVAKSKRVITKIEMSDIMKEYIVERDRCLWKEGKSIDELKIKYNL